MADAIRSTIPTATPIQNRPDYKRPEYEHAKPARDLCAALMLGTSGVRALGQVGLPKWPAEKEEHYKIRAAISQVARYYQRTVQASVGMICATPPSLNKDADPLLLADAEDVDGQGTHFEVFAKHRSSDAITGGFSAILVDAPPIPEGITLSLDDEQALGIRPFMVPVSADQIVSWVVETPKFADLLVMWSLGQITREQVKSAAKQMVLRQVVIHEPTDVASGAFGTACKDRYRVLQLTDDGVTFRVWEKRTGDVAAGEHFALISSGPMYAAGRQPFREIPLAVVYGGRKVAPFVAEPALMALAELNLDHYQVSADRRYLMHLCHAPTLTTIGLDEQFDETGRPKEIKVGPNALLMLPLGGDAKYVSADPRALESSKVEREELVKQMATLGMSFIGKDRRNSAETATGRALDAAAENASHATVARGLQDGLEQAWRYMAMYRGVQAPEVIVNTTYANADADPQVANILWLAVAAGQIPVDALIEYLKTGSLPDDLQNGIDTLRFIANDAAATDAALQVSAADNADLSQAA